MGKSIREVYGTVLAELGDTNENIVVLDADLSGSTKSGIFAKAHPERHFNMGIAESVWSPRRRAFPRPARSRS